MGETFSFLVVVFGGGGEEHVAAGIEGGFHGVLDNTDDEADGYSLHGHIIADAEERTCQGHQQQRSTSHPGSTASPQCSDDAENERRHETHLHAQCMGDRQCHDSNGDRSPIHIDGSPQRYADRIEILVDAQVFTQSHIDRDVGSRGTGEESVDAALLQACE